MSSPSLLASYFYDLSKICFTSLVIGGIIQSTRTGSNLFLIIFGIGITTGLFIVAKSTEQKQKGVPRDTKHLSRYH